MPWRRIAYLSSAVILVAVLLWLQRSKSGAQTPPQEIVPRTEEEAKFATQLAKAPFGLLGVRFYESY